MNELILCIVLVVYVFLALFLAIMIGGFGISVAEYIGADWAKRLKKWQK